MKFIKLTTTTSTAGVVLAASTAGILATKKIEELTKFDYLAIAGATAIGAVIGYFSGRRIENNARKLSTTLTEEKDKAAAEILGDQSTDVEVPTLLFPSTVTAKEAAVRLHLDADEFIGRVNALLPLELKQDSLLPLDTVRYIVTTLGLNFTIVGANDAVDSIK